MEEEEEMTEMTAGKEISERVGALYAKKKAILKGTVLNLGGAEDQDLDPVQYHRLLEKDKRVLPEAEAEEARQTEDEAEA
jgi:hypothetical protein